MRISTLAAGFIAKEALCIRVLGGTGRRYASVGDVIVVSVKSVIPSSDIKKGAVSKALIVRTKKAFDTAPFLTSLEGITLLIETTMTSPTEA